MAATRTTSAASIPTTLHIGFVDRATALSLAYALQADHGTSFAPDDLTILGREIHLHYPSGSGRSKMTGAFFERGLGTKVKVRNWRTVATLVDLADLADATTAN